MKILSSMRLLICIMIFVVLATGCCVPLESDPLPPGQPDGWHEYQGKYGITVLGTFLLRKGEVTEKGDLGIQLVDTVKGRTCRGTESMGPSAIVRFYSVGTKETVLQIEVRKGNSQLSGFNRTLIEESRIATMSVHEINTKDGWIWFELDRI
jgi:hypothetical protein